MVKDSFEVIKGRTSYDPGPVNIGIFDAGDGLIAIDSGNDKDAGRKLLKKIREGGMTLKAVVNTHSNADHIGANAYLQNNAPCEIWAPDVESAFIETPLLEPSFLWGGFPFKALRSKFFNAKPSRVDRLISEDKDVDGLSFIPLPGHFFNQYGILTEDGVFFLGDSIFGEEIITKYGLPFIYDVDAYCGSIEKIMNTEADYYVPAHGSAVTDITETAELNLETVEKAKKDIIGLLGEEMVFDNILKRFCDDRGISLNHGQYVLVGSTLKSFLANLSDDGRVEYYFRENMMYWKAL